jgi:hypothetical protein
MAKPTTPDIGKVLDAIIAILDSHTLPQGERVSRYELTPDEAEANRVLSKFHATIIALRQRMKDQQLKLPTEFVAHLSWVHEQLKAMDCATAH